MTAPMYSAHVFVVDDDGAIREALSSLFRSMGFDVRSFSTAMEFMAHDLPDMPSCLVLDIRLPLISGLEFQSQLARQNIHIPIIFMTGHGDIPMSVRAMKAGAVDFLTKPFRDQDMLDAVASAISFDRSRRLDEKSLLSLRERYSTLSPREQEVMAHVTSGLLNKQIAGKMSLSEITIKIHRGHAMKKMQARSLADLVTMARSLGLGHNGH
ncbi:response regulator transcription factor [Asticcacaulis sp. ZE23SCel15]|uniref:response regulator transcription factor n=1 Tax=Asticcacaulis sp. ZE23SCel15 TaxID=3059027 RepID=UPI0026601BBC|nr:response regulator transcription factor [Asticcacaulis sp. ZE23SCel15]WKL58652.1 response regulator transcription factor [Asticcacaulis sp. ZE23SCel15]